MNPIKEDPIAPFEVIFEDNHILVVVKQAGIPSQGDKTGDSSMVTHVKAFLKEKYDKKGEVYLGLVHRLDRPVGGIMVFGKTSKASGRLSDLFKTRTIRKVYFAICQKKPPKNQDQLIHYIKKDRVKNKAFAYKNNRSGTKEAILNYHYLGQKNGFHLIQVEPKTGRSHQIRVQLAFIGCPIVGDLKYGGRFPLENGKAIGLFAKKLEFNHPVGDKDKLSFTANFPSTPYWDLFKKFETIDE